MLRVRQGVRTGLGHGGITCVLQTQFSSFICQRVWKTVKCQGKIKEKSGNFEVADEWQPCMANSDGSHEGSQHSFVEKSAPEKNGLKG